MFIFGLLSELEHVQLLQHTLEREGCQGTFLNVFRNGFCEGRIREVCYILSPPKRMNLFEGLFPADRSLRGAVLFEGRQIAYAELRGETVRAAEVLHSLGVGNGDRVAVLLADSSEFIATFVAIISIGAIAVPINLALGREDQLFILKDCGACAAVVEASTASALLDSSLG